MKEKAKENIKYFTNDVFNLEVEHLVADVRLKLDSLISVNLVRRHGNNFLVLDDVALTGEEITMGIFDGELDGYFSIEGYSYYRDTNEKDTKVLLHIKRAKLDSFKINYFAGDTAITRFEFRLPHADRDGSRNLNIELVGEGE